MRLRIYIFVLSQILSLSSSWAQSCDLEIKGYVKDEFSKTPLSYTNISIEETGGGITADSAGFFHLKNLCEGEYHLKLSHLGGETDRFFIKLSRDTLLTLYLKHHIEFLEEVQIKGEARSDLQLQNQKVLGKEQIQKESGKALAQMLESISGVSTIKGGGGISKPVIHGLYGNRVAVLNNGIAQAGQQWGNDHAPEIDPNTAQQISVVKGVGAVEYGSNILGGIIKVSPGNISPDPHIHGLINYNFQSNGLGHSLAGRLEKSDDWGAWRITGSLKFNGDQRSPNYFLTNTGTREANIAAQWDKNVNYWWKSRLYYSLFNTELGILRGSHIGNLTDLQNAIGNRVPAFTADTFSYKINPPRQVVQHHLLKWENHFLFPDQSSLTFIYGGQLNDRKEFDVRRSGRSEIPSLSLFLQSHFADVKYQKTLESGLSFKVGTQGKFVDNNNNPETGIFPLIPNYRKYNSALYALLYSGENRLMYELGARYDYQLYQVATINVGPPAFVERFEHSYHNYALLGSLKFTHNSQFTSRLNLGMAQRSPDINELYSQGLHQGVSGIEEGDRSLIPETSMKAVLSNTLIVGKQFFLESTAYLQNIDNYIFLEPEDEYRLTIRGAFPVFRYKQTGAQIMGWDLLAKFTPVEKWEWITKYSVIRGHDLSNDLPLVYMPANNFFSSISFLPEEQGNFHFDRLSINAKYVFRQNRLLPEQDFLAPPDAYFLLGAEWEGHIQLGESKVAFSLQAENILNTVYRDYLNRLRYYADDLGINIRLGIRYEF
ncbi:MAG: TonB-dependent receptor [Bacteroidia bacterium]|nr:TonB-dependent receptor [Bacteroidia bacterium]